MKKNKNLSIFITCMLIAMVIWLSMSMSKVYQKTYEIPIVYENIPIDQHIVKEQAFLKTTVTASGWDLLSKKISKRTILIDISNYEYGNLINITSTKSIVKDNFSDLNILDVTPTMFTLKLKKLATKKIPIRLNLNKNFATNFHINKSTVLTPDSIIIVSDSEELNNISFIETELINITEKDTVIDHIKLVVPTKVKTNFNKIKAKFNIEEFAEKEFVVPINIENKPIDADLVYYPEEITIKCLIPFSDFEKIIASDFYISADFNNIELSKNNTLDLSISGFPKSVKNIQLGKDKIEFIIYSN